MYPIRAIELFKRNKHCSVEAAYCDNNVFWTERKYNLMITKSKPPFQKKMKRNLHKPPKTDYII